MKYILFFILLFFIVSAKSFAENKTTIKVSSTIEVTFKEKYSLYDLVQVQGMTSEVEQSLKKSEVALQSSASSVAMPQKKWIDLFKKNNLVGSSIQLVIPESTTIQQKTKFSEEEYNRKVKNQLSLICANCEFETQASSKIQMNSLKNQAVTNWSMDVNSITRLQSSVLVRVEMDSNVVWIPTLVKAFSYVLVAKRNLLNVKELTTDDYHLQLRDIATLSSPPITMDKLSQMSLGQAVSQGTVLTESLFRKTTVIKKGQIVKVLLNENEFEIVLQASAEESGAVGDLIKIKTIGTNKVLSAVIQQDQSVVVK